MRDDVLFPESDETLHATTRYLAALTELSATDLHSPSALPGWTRAHVVAHLSRNAEALGGVLLRLAAGEPAAMYPTAESREYDIAATVATRDRDALVEETQATAATFAEAAAGFPHHLASATYSRLAGDPAVFEARIVMGLRRTEVEVHHADLLLAYTPAQWPEDFSRSLVRRRQDELAEEGGPSMVLASTDVDGLWKLGSGPGPEITGAVGDLAWWLVGRGQGRGLVSSTGELPRLARWR